VEIQVFKVIGTINCSQIFTFYLNEKFLETKTPHSRYYSKEPNMDTIIKSEQKEVKISFDAPFTIIGEKINPTGRKKLAAALKEGNYDYVRSLATRQVETGADILDVNVGVPGLDEVAVLPEVARLVSEAVDAPLCLDSANHKAIAAALEVLPGKPLVNSVNGEEKSLSAVLPVVKEFGVAVIGLTMDDDGIPNDAETRLAIAEKILDRAAQLGISAEQVVHRPPGAHRGLRQQGRRSDPADHPALEAAVRRQRQPGCQQRLLRSPRPAHHQPGFPLAGHGHWRHLRHH
jgi:cobalamin-dependent methionine synthase I